MDQDKKNKKKVPFSQTIEHGKLPPQSVEVEIAVLGAILLEKDAILDVIDILSEESFYKEANQNIYSALKTLNNQSQPIDILTVTQQMIKDKTLEISGGPYYLSKLTERVASSANIVFHARIIEQNHIKRSVIKNCGELITTAYDNSSDTFEIVEDFLSKAYEIGDVGDGDAIETNTETLRRLKENIQNADKLKGITGLTTGISKIDKLYGGYQKTHLIIKAGRPAMGKSSQALCEAHHMANECGKNVLFFSLEMSSIELMQRVVSVATGIPLNKLKEGKLNTQDWSHYNEITSDLMTENLKIVDKAGMSLNQIKKISKKHAIKNGLDAIYIDYLQLISNNIKGGNREQEISSISRGLKQLAKDLDIPVIALSQLSRAVEQRGGDKRPILSDLRESGSIEQDADSVQFLYRPEYYGLTEDEEGNSTAGVGYLMVAKNRHGATKDIAMHFNPYCTKFSDLTDESDFNSFDNASLPTGEGFEGHIPTSSQDSKEKDDAPF
jgi:replicative DNA helicase